MRENVKYALIYMGVAYAITLFLRALGYANTGDYITPEERASCNSEWSYTFCTTFMFALGVGKTVAGATVVGALHPILFNNENAPEQEDDQNQYAHQP